MDSKQSFHDVAEQRLPDEIIELIFTAMIESYRVPWRKKVIEHENLQLGHTIYRPEEVNSDIYGHKNEKYHKIRKEKNKMIRNLRRINKYFCKFVSYHFVTQMLNIYKQRCDIISDISCVTIKISPFKYSPLMITNTENITMLKINSADTVIYDLEKLLKSFPHIDTMYIDTYVTSLNQCLKKLVLYRCELKQYDTFKTLETLHIYYPFYIGQISDAVHYDLPELTELKIYCLGVYMHNYSYLISQFSAPKLTHLLYHGSKEIWDGDDIFNMYVLNEFPLLQCIEIKNMIIDNSEFIQSKSLSIHLSNC